MKYLLDTNTCIYYLKYYDQNLVQKLKAIPRRDIKLCSIVKAELYYGVTKSNNPEKNLKRLISFWKPYSSLPFDDTAAKVYGDLRADLESKGLPIGANDLLIASIAIANGLVLVSSNTDEFERIKHLQLENWYKSRV
jgi:tRNA(fMet)-specific endonuclease VapC